MSEVPPRDAARGVASGLFLMAVFTLLWSSLADSGLGGAAGTVVFVVAVIVAVVFVASGVRLLRVSRRFPESSEHDDDRPRDGEGEPEGRSGLSFGLVFAAEGVLIGVASGILSHVGRSDDIVPVIAIIVGAHFAPMARIFERTIDYWLSAWTITVGVAGLIVVHTSGVDPAWALVGSGAALATATYGAYMSRIGAALLRSAACVRVGP